MGRVTKVGLWLVGVIVVGFLILNVVRLRQLETASQAGPFITANPLDLNQIGAISQFRSCEGHNYSGLNANGEEETYRTMKHYIESVAELAQTRQQVKILAPFDGRIADIAPDQRGTQVRVVPTADASGWEFIFFHVDLLPSLTEDAPISAGDHIGYADLTNAANFDIAMRNFWPGQQLNDSPFLYMTETVLAEYASAGVTLDNIIISKEERDAVPCQLAPGQTGRDSLYARSESGKSWVAVQ